MDRPYRLAILIFDEVEVLDFCGPFEVFSVAGKREKLDLFDVYTVAEASGQIYARNKLSINPAYTINNCPKPDILLVPGGFGTRREMNNEVLLSWIRETAAKAQLLLSVCTGALMLARAGLLEGLTATTHKDALDLLEEVAPNTTVVRQRMADNGDVVLSAGISAGIDMSFHIVQRLYGKEMAEKTAYYMEYDWPRGALAE